MKGYSFQIALIVALVCILLTSAVVFAFPAESSGGDPVPSVCPVRLDRAQRLVNTIDIPAHRADYVLLDKISRCQTMSKTGTGASNDRYVDFKNLQADLMMGK